MKFFLDTANLDEIRQAKEWGMLDGVTTNPTLMSREEGDWIKQAEAICREVEGPVSLEVVGLTADEMIKEARDLVKLGPNVVVKIPLIMEGLKATRILTDMNIETNVTLCFSAAQALLAAKAGATYVSPFVGRLDAMGQEGMALVEEILHIYANYEFDTQVIVASIRTPMHVKDAALMGAHVATIPPSVIKQLAHHPLTDKGLESFLADWKKVVGK